MTHTARTLQSQDLSREGIELWIIYILFYYSRTWRASPDEWPAQCRDPSETTQTWKTIHTIHTPIHSNKANMKGRLWLPNDIRGPYGPKASWHSSYRWGKTPKKLHWGNLSRPRIEPGPAAWQARMLPLAPQRWTIVIEITSGVIRIYRWNQLLQSVKTGNFLFYLMFHGSQHGFH